MNLLLDTNIIINICRAPQYSTILKYLNPKNDALYMSLASYAEIMSFAVKNKWGIKRLDKLNEFVASVRVIEITDFLVGFYVEIDTFSQRKNPNFVEYNFSSAITMGKNDLWIAATAAFLDLQLVTTDKDFDHLNEVFCSVRYIVPQDLRIHF